MSLIAELKRRNVFRVGVAYAIVAWLSDRSGSRVVLASPTASGLDSYLSGDQPWLLVGFPLALIVRLGVRADAGGDQARNRC